VPQRFLNKLKYGDACISMQILPRNKKERNRMTKGIIYRQLSHCSLVDNTIPIITEVIEKPFVPSKLIKVESAQGAAITYFTEDISDNEYERESVCESPWKKCKMEQLPPLKSIWGESATYCCYDCSSFNGFIGITCISNDDASDVLAYESDVYDDFCDDLCDDYDDLCDDLCDADNTVYYSSEDNLVPNSYLFGSSTSLRELLTTYNKMCRV